MTMFTLLPLLLALLTLWGGSHVTQVSGLNRLAYQQVVEMSLLPPDNEINRAKIQKAIIELVTTYYNHARGVYYPIGTATGLFSAGRRKRFADFSSSFGGGGWGSSASYNPWGSFPFSSFYGGNKYNTNNDQTIRHYPSSNTGKDSYPKNNYYYGGNTYKGFGGNQQIINCPTQVNQSAAYMLNSSTVAYPSTDIGNEFFARSLPGSDLFFQCAIRRAVLPDTPPTVDVDQNFVTANHTCPSQDLDLFSYIYQNTAIGGRCWIVQGFQESVTFTVCQQKECTNCKLKPATSRSRPSSYSSYDHSHPHSHPHQPHPDVSTRNVTVNQCLQEYRTAQALVYCENLPVNQRIIYDRIIIPVSCGCKSIDCMTSNSHW